MFSIQDIFFQVVLLLYYIFLFTLSPAVCLSFLDPELETTELEINKIQQSEDESALGH